MSAGPEPICGTGVGAVVPAGGVGTGACPSAALIGNSLLPQNLADDVEAT